MNIAIVALGSRGDVQPMVAFARGIAAAGYEVRVVTHEPFRQLVTDLGLSFTPSRLDVQAFLREGEGQAWLEAGDNPVRAILQFRRAAAPHLPELFAELYHATADADVIVGISPGLLEATLADAAGARFLRASLKPLTATRAFPHLTAFPFAQMPGPLNRFTYLASEQVWWQLFRRELQAFRRSLGLQPISWRGPYGRLMRERSLVLNAYSPLVVPHPPDWPNWIQTTGYWRFDDPNEGVAPPDLKAFLDAGPPPVYVGFGSMTPRNAAALTDTVTQALRRLGLRGILLSGWGGLTSGIGKIADDLFGVDRVSHSWLLPQTLAAVHHGGAGTTAAAICAGVPSAVVPMFGDQAFWGGRVARLGLGPHPLRYQHLTLDALVAAIEFAISEPVRARAADFGRDVAAETGVANAVEIFSRYVGDPSRREPWTISRTDSMTPASI